MVDENPEMRTKERMKGRGITGFIVVEPLLVAVL